MMRALVSVIFASLIFSCDSGEFLVTDVDRTCITSITQKNSPLEIWRYKYNNQFVYLTVADCCDQYNYLYDSNCKLLCAPSGGFSGSGDGKCPDFKDKATDGTLVWKKD